MPSASDNRGNLAAGATGVVRPLNDRDRELVARIGPALAARGMLFVGLDVIGGFVTEINVTSPTGVREIDKQCGHRPRRSRCSMRSSAGSPRGQPALTAMPSRRRRWLDPPGCARRRVGPQRGHA